MTPNKESGDERYFHQYYLAFWGDEKVKRSLEENIWPLGEHFSPIFGPLFRSSWFWLPWLPSLKLVSHRTRLLTHSSIPIASSKYSPQSDSTGIGDVAVNFARDQVGKCYS